MSGPLLLVELHGVEVRARGAAVLRDVSFGLREGEHWAVLGGNGAGKSTFLRLLRGEVWPHPDGGGWRLYHFVGPPSESPIGARDQMALVSSDLQDTYVRRDWNVPVEHVVRSAFGGGVWPSEPLTPDEEERARGAMALLGVERMRGRSILELSSGEARKVLLARALAPGPRVLLLDEFCDGLDDASRADILERVSAIARAGTTVVSATHRLDEIPAEVTHVARLEAGRLVAQGPRAQVLPAAPPPPPPGADAPAHPGAGWRQAVPAGEAPSLITLEHAEVWVDGKVLLRDVTWTLREGEQWLVRGPNGSGKSTLLRLLAGAHYPAEGGYVRRLDFPERSSLWDVRRRIALVTPLLQAAHRYDITGEEVVLSGHFGSVGLADEVSAAQREAAVHWMERLGLGALAQRRIHGLSYGELRKLMLARALVGAPEMLLLDEPFNGLDTPARERLEAVLAELVERGTHLVMTTHHRGEMLPLFNRVLELREGRIVGTAAR